MAKGARGKEGAGHDFKEGGKCAAVAGVGCAVAPMHGVGDAMGGIGCVTLLRSG